MLIIKCDTCEGCKQYCEVQKLGSKACPKWFACASGSWREWTGERCRRNQRCSGLWACMHGTTYVDQHLKDLGPWIMHHECMHTCFFSVCMWENPKRKKEFQSLKKFGDSLLNRSAKLTELVSQLDQAIDGVGQESPHRARANKYYDLKLYHLFSWTTVVERIERISWLMCASTYMCDPSAIVLRSLPFEVATMLGIGHQDSWRAVRPGGGSEVWGSTAADWEALKAWSSPVTCWEWPIVGYHQLYLKIKTMH